MSQISQNYLIMHESFSDISKQNAQLFGEFHKVEQLTIKQELINKESCLK
jgi:hypothetical protein